MMLKGSGNRRRVRGGGGNATAVNVMNSTDNARGTRTNCESGLSASRGGKRAKRNDCRRGTVYLFSERMDRPAKAKKSLGRAFLGCAIEKETRAGCQDRK